MRTVKLVDLLERARARKRALGLTETPEQVDALRNPGGRRTPEKRALLRRAAARATAAGVTPVVSYF